MFTFGFYNAMKHDRRYNAEEVSSMFDGIILDGIYMHVGNRFIVKSKEELDDTVIVGSGRAWFNHTWSLNDADMAMKGPKSDVVKNRIDAIVIDVDTRDLQRKNQLLWLTGPITGANDGQRPTLIKEDGHYQYPLCYISRRASSKAIHQADITNMVGTSSAPFVTGVLQGMDIDDLIAQWEDQWHRFVVRYQEETIEWRDQQQAQITAYMNEWKNQMNSFTTSEQQKFLTWVTTKQNEYTSWISDKQTNFTNWIKMLEEVLDENAAGHLYNMVTQTNTNVSNLDTKLTTNITQITETEFLHHYDLVNGTTVINNKTNVITTTTTEGTSVTNIGQKANGVQIITTIVTPNTGTFKYNRSVTITDTADGNTIQTSYTKVSK